MVLGHQRQGQVDAGGYAGRGDQRAAAHMDAVGSTRAAGKRVASSSANSQCVVTVTVQQPGVAEREGAGADRSMHACAWAGLPQPAAQGGVVRGRGHPPPAPRRSVRWRPRSAGRAACVIRWTGAPARPAGTPAAGGPAPSPSIAVAAENTSMGPARSSAAASGPKARATLRRREHQAALQAVARTGLRLAGSACAAALRRRAPTL